MGTSKTPHPPIWQATSGGCQPGSRHFAFRVIENRELEAFTIFSSVEAFADVYRGTILKNLFSAGG